MNHVTLRMPTLVLHIPINLHKLLENRATAPDAFGGEARRIVEMTIDVPVVLVVGILLAEDGGTDGACEVL